MDGRDCRLALFVVLATVALTAGATPGSAQSNEHFATAGEAFPDLGSLAPQATPPPGFCAEPNTGIDALAAPFDRAAPPTPSAAEMPVPPATDSPAPPLPAPPLAFDQALGIPHTPFGKQIYRVALRYALNPLVVAAVVEAESDFNPRAISRKGARGLMQVMPATGRRFGYGRRDLLNPGKNLEAGARYLRWLVNHFGDDAMRVLAAYNAGEGSVERFGGLPPFPETRDYVQRIFTRLGFAIALPTLDAAVAVASR